jgi:hypothetical protein
MPWLLANVLFATAVQVTPSEECAILPSMPTATNLLLPQAMSRISELPKVLSATAVHLSRLPLAGAVAGDEGECQRRYQNDHNKPYLFHNCSPMRSV